MTLEAWIIVGLLVALILEIAVVARLRDQVAVRDRVIVALMESATDSKQSLQRANEAIDRFVNNTAVCE